MVSGIPLANARGSEVLILNHSPSGSGESIITRDATLEVRGQGGPRLARRPQAVPRSTARVVDQNPAHGLRGDAAKLGIDGLHQARLGVAAAGADFAQRPGDTAGGIFRVPSRQGTDK